jgi:penicillin-binding protein 1A
MFKKILKYFLLTSIIFTSIISIYLLYVYLFSKSILEDNIVNYSSPKTTQVFDKKGDLIANIFDKEHRLFVPYKEIPIGIIEALVATEDTSFFEHNGINIEAIIRAIVKDVKARKFIEGASTITQQLIKVSLLTRDKTIVRKIKEVVMSLRLETLLSKEDIIERYLNEIYFGHSYHGIKTASNGYFRKELNELTLKEIAMLVGIPKAPTSYNPTRYYEKCINRANKVLLRLKTIGWIDSQSFLDAYNEQPTVYNDSLTKNKAPYVIDYLKSITRQSFNDLTTGGYIFYLSIDLSLQKLAKESLQYGAIRIKERNLKLGFDDNKTDKLNGAIISIDSTNGDILALVGGVDYKTSKFNRVTQAYRQPGSSIKPFIYQIALNNGYGLNTELIDITRTYKYQKNDENLTWRPKNYEDNTRGLIPLQNALIHSRNLATINLVTDLGLTKIYKTLLNYGFDNKLPKDLSISLGSFGISPIKMAEFYSIFSNYGKKVKPILIKRIRKIGEEDLVFLPQEEVIMSPQQAFLGIHMLQQIVSHGTGLNARVSYIQTAGKTGTTNNNIDAWFCGFSPTIETIVWYGNDDSKPMNKKETGGKSAAPAFAYFYKNLLKLYPHIQRKFEVPEGVHKKGIYYYTTTSPLSKKEKKPRNELVF